DPDMWYEKGRAHRVLSQNQLALPAYNQAIKLNDNKAMFYYERSKTHYLLQDIVKAKDDYQKSIQLGFQIPQGDTYPAVLGY
ncbi:MAG: hypothetical protein WAT79_00005, partial [Saprospiraceae bacterium]